MTTCLGYCWTMWKVDGKTKNNNKSRNPIVEIMRNIFVDKYYVPNALELKKKTTCYVIRSLVITKHPSTTDALILFRATGLLQTWQTQTMGLYDFRDTSKMYDLFSVSQGLRCLKRLKKNYLKKYALHYALSNFFFYAY